MALDAFVFCNCFETKRLKEKPPVDIDLFVSEYGSIEWNFIDLQTDLILDQWIAHSACENQNSVLLHHYLGNIALIALLRSELAIESHKFPVLLEKVLYSGTHCGDFLPFADVELLKIEVSQLSNHISLTKVDQHFVNEFQKKMEELIAASLLVQKPISF